MVVVFWAVLGVLLGAGCDVASDADTGDPDGPVLVDDPGSGEGRCVGALVHAFEDIPVVASAGLGWVRPHPGPFSWELTEPQPGLVDWTATDEVVRAAGPAGLSIIATLWPYAYWDQASCRTATCEVPPSDEFLDSAGPWDIPGSRCAPCDLEAWAMHVSRLVERYDGDGEADMPGMERPVLHWEVLNEPEMVSPELTFFVGTPDEYVDLLAVTAAAVHDACPECRALLAGEAGTYVESVAWWDAAMAAGAEPHFDLANIHFLGQGDATSFNAVPYAAQLAGQGILKPFWVTEAEPADADQVVDSLLRATSAGAEVVIFTQLGLGGPPGTVHPALHAAADACP